jgi:flagellar motor switch protein FliM
LSDLMNLQAGDVLSTDFSGNITLLAEDIPMFRGAYGLSHGQQAVKIDDCIRRTRPGSGSEIPARRCARALQSSTPTTDLGVS